MTAFRDRLVGHIVAERERQVELWGPQTDLSLSRLTNIITEEAGEIAMAVNDLLQETDTWAQTKPPVSQRTEALRQHFSNLETELIQTAACCLKMLEALDEGTYSLG